MLHDAAVKGLRPVLFKIQFDVLNNAGHYCATKVIFFINAGVCFCFLCFFVFVFLGQSVEIMLFVII